MAMVRCMAECRSKGTGGTGCRGHPRQGREFLPAASSSRDRGFCSSGLARSNCGNLKWPWGAMCVTRMRRWGSRGQTGIESVAVCIEGHVRRAVHPACGPTGQGSALSLCHNCGHVPQIKTQCFYRESH